MRKTDIFYINGKKLELPLFQKGDRVYIHPKRTTSSKRVEGTVSETSMGGLFVDVEWDKETYPTHPSLGGGNMQPGKQWMVDSLLYIEEEEK